jgi:hypothetical protein
VDADHILPLLDGLDEVASEHRAACVGAINTFRQNHGFLPLVVCSRMTDYAALDMRLRLQGAIVVQPLTRVQVERYLTQVGGPLSSVRQALQEDPTLWELLETPLMLTIVTLAYAGEPFRAFHASGTLEAKRRDLFAAYVDRMFQRRRAVTRYTRPQTERWLAWLAWQMTQHSQTVFYLERMQHDWLPQGQRWLPTKGIMWGGGLGSGLGVGLGVGASYGLGSGLGVGLSTMVAAAYVLSTNRSGYTRGMVSVETVHWSWSAVRSQRKALFGVLLSGLTVGLGVGLLAGLSTGLLGVLGSGLSRGEIKTQTTPNEGIHRSARLALVFGLGGGLVFGLVGWLLAGLGIKLGVGLLVGLGGGLVFGLDCGGLTCLQHLVLRLLLVRNGFAPWCYVEFLDYATERIFLRNVGGGYIFIHRLLQDYFAAMYQSDRVDSPPGAPSTAP